MYDYSQVETGDEISALFAGCKLKDKQTGQDYAYFSGVGQYLQVVDEIVSSSSATTTQSSSTTSSLDTVVMHRYYNQGKGVHFYTASESQANKVRNQFSPPFQDEGIKFYVYRSDSDFGTDLQKFYNPDTSAHFFTAFSNEINALKNDSRFNTVFDDEGVAFRVLALE